MAVRKIVMIDEDKCDGCGLCVPSCAEGAIQIIDGKAHLVDDKFCSGLGACLSECSNGAITITEREAEEFDAKSVEVHLKRENESEASYDVGAKEVETADVVCACPSCSVTTFEKKEKPAVSKRERQSISRLAHWPIQLKLTPPQASFFKPKYCNSI